MKNTWGPVTSQGATNLGEVAKRGMGKAKGTNFKGCGDKAGTAETEQKGQGAGLSKKRWWQEAGLRQRPAQRPRQSTAPVEESVPGRLSGSPPISSCDFILVINRENLATVERELFSVE